MRIIKPGKYYEAAGIILGGHLVVFHFIVIQNQLHGHETYYQAPYHQENCDSGPNKGPGNGLWVLIKSTTAASFR